VPCFFSDGFSSYCSALIEVYHQVKEFARTGKRGRPRKPVLEPHPQLVYAQLVKKKKSLRLPLPAREQPGAGLIRPKWQPRTPGMAASLTDHVWTFRELLTDKFEPILNQSISG
jgi:hypothetical protein